MSGLPILGFCAVCAASFRVCVPPAMAHGPEKAGLAGVGLEEKTGRKIPLDIVFSDERGEPLELGRYIDRPTIALPVYYSCRDQCALLIENLASALDRIPLEPGRDYRVLTLSIDGTEKPADAMSAKKTYRPLLAKHFNDEDWRFLTGDDASILRFTGAAGYHFRKTGPDVVHPNVLMVLSRDGTIIRYIYGPGFLPFDLGMALTEAAKGVPALTIRKALSLCFSYDPEKKTYTFRAAQAVTLAVTAVIGAVLFFLLRKPAPGGGNTP